MRRIRYQVVSSLDGYIAGPEGEVDWIPMEPGIDFDAYVAQFDTLLMGRGTYESAVELGGGFFGKRVVVVSTTLRPDEHPDVTLISDDLTGSVAALRAQEGADIWLFGGGQLFRGLLEGGLVDTVEIAVAPVLLGAGIPLLPGPALRRRLSLTAHQVYPSGIALMEYAVRSPGRSSPAGGG